MLTTKTLGSEEKVIWLQCFQLSTDYTFVSVFFMGEKGHVRFLLIKLILEYEILSHNTLELFYCSCCPVWTW